MSRGVDDINLMVLPETGRRSGGNSNTTLALLLHPIHLGRTLVYFTNFVLFSGIKEHTFRHCGLTGINVSNNADVTNFL